MLNNIYIIHFKNGRQFSFLHKKVAGPWTKYKHNANLGNAYSSYKYLHQANTMVSQYRYLKICRTFENVENFTIWPNTNRIRVVITLIIQVR